MKNEQTIHIPDIGGVSQVDVIEVLVALGDCIEVDTPLLTLESDKASMEIPSPVAGTVSSLLVKVGDKVSEGSPIVNMMVETTENAAPVDTAEPKKQETIDPIVTQTTELESVRLAFSQQDSIPQQSSSVHAGPAVRRLARELGVDLSLVTGTGHKSRITREDLLNYFKSHSFSGESRAFAVGVPEIDFSQFGPIEKKSLSKIKRLTAQHMHRSWATIPHVTQFGEADITDLEAFRQSELKQAEAAGYKLTLLAFVVKALTKMLVQFPQFNSSLDPSGESLIYKQYLHIGIAVDTPNGLVVPVIKHADQLSIGEIAQEMQRISTKAREKGLAPAEMQGGTFTVSSLGGIGGTAFTPIVNAPEVAILGLSKAEFKPVYLGQTFVPRLMLPLSLSYDHRVIDGAEGAKFLKGMTLLLNDVRRILL